MPGVVVVAAYYALYPLVQIAESASPSYREYGAEYPAFWAATFFWYMIMCLCGINLYRMKNRARRAVRFFAAVHIIFFVIGIILLIFISKNETIAELPLFDLPQTIFVVASVLIHIATWIYLGRTKVIVRFIHPDGKTAKTFLAEKVAEKNSENSAKSFFPK